MLEINKIHLGNNLDLLKQLADNSIDSIVTDPPYGISFMNKKWDYDVPPVELWKEALRVLKPGGHMLVACGTRTQHRMAVRIEDAGFEIRDIVAWVYGSGFPKSLNIGLAIDKKMGVQGQRGIGGFNVGGKEEQNNRKAKLYIQSNSDGSHQEAYSDYKTIEAKQYAGFGTALKPAMELWTLARKPLKGTVAENVLKYGTGGLNIDGCRVGVTEADKYDLEKRGVTKGVKHDNLIQFTKTDGYDVKHGVVDNGRFPANFIHDGSDEVVELFPNTQSGLMTPNHTRTTDGSPNGIYGKFDVNHPLGETYGDSGSAARFFYTAKASQEERNMGLSEQSVIKIEINENMLGDGIKWKDALMDLVTLLQKVTFESTVKWNIAENGKSIMGQCQTASLYTILTEIKKITILEISNLLTHSLINDFILDASLLTENGGNHAKNAENYNQSLNIIKEKTGFVRGVDLVVSKMLSEISEKGNWKNGRNIHNTVKPVDLMRYLVRLITPPNGLCLDMYLGSGTTAIAAKLENMRYIGIERESEYCAIAEARIAECDKDYKTKESMLSAQDVKEVYDIFDFIEP